MAPGESAVGQRSLFSSQTLGVSNKISIEPLEYGLKKEQPIHFIKRREAGVG